MQTIEKSLERIRQESRQQIVGKVLGAKVTRGELEQAFELVRDRKHWKNPIDAEIELENSDAKTRALIAEAIVFFTGSQAHFSIVRATRFSNERDSGASLVRVRALGYYLTIGA